MQLHRFINSSLLNQHFAQRVLDILSKAIVKRDKAYLVVSGGKTPIGLFQHLAKGQIPWQKVTIFLTDERCVSTLHEDSNEYLVKKYLLQENASQAAFISLNPCPTPEESCESVNKSLAGLPFFDVVVLGMGEDGHTASLFPCSEELDLGLGEQKDSALIVRPKTAPYTRISLTKERLLKTEFIFLDIIGEKKLEVFDKAMTGFDCAAMPVRAFLHSELDLQVMFAPE